jgi:site-specific recombinase XerD
MNRNDDLLTGRAAASEPVGPRVRIFLRGRVWYANFQQGGKQHRVSLETGSKKEARRRAVQIEADLDGGRWKPAAAPVSLADAIAAYLNFLRTEDRAAKTLSKYTKTFSRLAELAGQKNVTNLDGITKGLVDAYRELRKEQGAAPKTRYTETVIIRQLINFALSRDMLAADPLKGLKVKKPKPTRQPCWTAEEVKMILAASPAEVRPALTLLAETGLRFAEMAWLTWEDIDVTANILHVRAKDGWRPKTGDERVVPLSPKARQVLESLPQRWPCVLTMPPSRFHPEPGRQWSERRLLAILRRVLRGLNLPGKLHTFRHFFISNALMRGIPEAIVRKWVGHVDPEVIKLYTHVHDGISQMAMRSLSEANEREPQEVNDNVRRENDDRSAHR